MLSALFFGGGGGGGGGDGGGVSKLKADRRNSSSSTWTTLFSRRNSTADADEPPPHRQHHHHHHHHHQHPHDEHSRHPKKQHRASRGLSSSSTLSLALSSRPPPVPAGAGATASSALKPQKRQPLPSPSSPPSSFPQTATATSSSKKPPAGRQFQSVDSLGPKTTANTNSSAGPAPVVVVGHPTGGYASTKPIRAADPPQLPPPFRHSAFGPALLAQSSLFPKPAAYIYTARSAFSSSTMSFSSSSPPPGAAASGATDSHKRHSKRDRSPSPSRRRSSRRLKSQSTRDLDPPDIGCQELPTPPDSRRATPAHRPRESSRNLSTINEDQPERTKSRSKKTRRRHRTPEEKEERERRKRKARDADEERLDEIRRNAEKLPVSNVPEAPTRTPPPPPPGAQDQQAPTPRYTTPVIPSRRDSTTPATQSILRSSAANILQAITGSLDRQKGVSSKTSKDRLSGSSPKSSSTRVLLQQTEQSTKVKVDLGDPAPAAHRDEGDSTESDKSECHTPKNAEFPIHKLPGDRKGSIHSSPNVKIVGEDVSDDLLQQTDNIDFLLPYGGLQEQFDSGYEIEQDIDEDEFFPEDSPEDGTVLAGGSQPPRRKSHAGFPTLANSVLNVDPLSQQLPVLISLIDNTVTAYETILETQGSLAVGIGGYQPVARRLLEKVGKLFSRELPPDAATWGETLEYIQERKEIPELLDCELDDEAVSEFFDHDDEKMFIYTACLEEPEVLDPAIGGLRRLMDEPVTPEETAIYLTTYPHMRPLLLTFNAMTDDELDILESKEAAAFLNVDIAVRSDKQREVTECAELSRGIDETVKKMEAIISRMRSVQTSIQKRKKGIEAHLAIHAPVDDDTPALAPEIQTAIDEIQNEDIIKMEERKRRRKELKKELEDEEDDGDTLLPDDSISQINPYRARRIPQSVARAYQQAQTRAAAAAAAPQVPGSVVSTRTSTSILQEHFASRAPPRQTAAHNTADPMMSSAEFDAGQGGAKKMNAYFRVPLPVKIYGSLMNDLKEKVRRFPLHPASSGRNLEAIPERSEVPDVAPYEDTLHRSSSRSSTKVPSSRNLLSGSSSKRSGLFSKKVVEPHPHDGGDRSCTPVVIHAPGVGGYSSSKPVLATGEASLRKEDREKERAREKEKRRREKGKSGSSSSRRRDSYVERPRK
ncbi:hypothetical protein TWF696_007745 [Orbilia brochopaga]|uniref:Uncharacterized protein n=1 Tax=Orbilia brochopaga TaxID=3140254 RepID=A0AAV9UMK3_9PEZI